MGHLTKVDPIVYGYHGTSAQNAATILATGFARSGNPYDWLGDGVYFFQDAPGRALEWAIENHPTAPAVIGAEIRLTDCLDLLDTQWTRTISHIYDGYVDHLKRAGMVPPRQVGGAHRLDREVINYAVGVLAEQGISVACVRGAFREGRPVYADSAIYDRAHVQIAVRDLVRCIVQIWQEATP